MSIEFICPQCTKQLRVGDENAGRKARCPQCDTICQIPAAEAEVVELFPTTGPKPSSAQQRYFIDSVSGQTYGPVGMAELSVWVREGRLSANCLIRGEHETVGKPAYQYFPSLMGAVDRSTGASTAARPASIGNPYDNPTQPGPGNPYLAPAAHAKQSKSRGRIVGQTVSVGDILGHASEVFSQHVGLLVGATLTIMAVGMIDSVLDRISEVIEGPIVVAIFCLGLVLNLIQTWLTIGLVQMTLKMARGKHTSYEELFGGGRKLLPIIGFYLLVGLPLFAVGLVIFLMMAFSVQFVILCAVVIGLLVLMGWMFIWPCYYLIVDDKAGVFESFGLAFEISIPNLANVIVLVLATIGIFIVGFLALCIGLIFAAPFVSLMWSTAYLMMTGQLHPK